MDIFTADEFVLAWRLGQSLKVREAHERSSGAHEPIVRHKPRSTVIPAGPDIPAVPESCGIVWFQGGGGFERMDEVRAVLGSRNPSLHFIEEVQHKVQVRLAAVLRTREIREDQQ